MNISTICFALTALVLTPGSAWSQDGDWPRVLEASGNQVVVYQPQADSFDGVTLRSRVAVSMKKPEDDAPSFGALWVNARFDTSTNSDLAHVVSLEIDRTRFAEVADSDVQWLVQYLEAGVLQWYPPISLTRLKASIKQREGQEADYQNLPPKIILSESPAVLLLLDGAPRLQAVGSGDLQRVVNTALPVIFDPINRHYWFYVSSGWFKATDLLNGAWTWTEHAPANIAALVKDTDTLVSPQTASGEVASPAQLRAARIVVSTEPAELIVTEGSPRYSPLVAGEILYITNTHSDIFLDVATQHHYIVIAGRWFAGSSIRGPWTFVAPENLPAAFAKIPGNSTKANVLAFVPGTERAKDALLDNAIPQTAEVSRGTSTIGVQYDGAPRFSPIQNTALEYAENTPSEVIRSNGTYYACEDGVWYIASSPTGPWAVSDTRPAGVEDIPPASPLYNTRFVYIYDSTPYLVRVGYLPGYRWSFPYHGAIYYGTGWRYRGWVGRHYYPRPITWGFFPRYDPWIGWTFGMSWTPGWLSLTSGWGAGWAGWGPAYGLGYRVGFWSGFYAGGWFGPGGYRPPRPPSWHQPGRPAPGRGEVPSPRPGMWPGNNLYVRPGKSGVRPRPGTLPGRPATGPRPGQPQVRPDRPGPGRPAIGRPVPDRPDNGSPNAPRPRAGQPSGGRLGIGHPGIGRPGAGRPDPVAPGTGQSGAGGPGVGRPHAGTLDPVAPGAGRSDGGRPDVVRPRTGRQGGGRPDTGRPGGAPSGREGRGNGGRSAYPGTRPNRATTTPASQK